MVLQKIKNYQDRIANVFRRFPLAVCFAAFATITFIVIHSIGGKLLDGIINGTNPIGQWFFFYPVGAMALSFNISLLYENYGSAGFGKRFHLPQIQWITQAVTAAIWGILCAILIIFYGKTPNTFCIAAPYLAILATPLIAPFIKRKNDLDIWCFTSDLIKGTITSLIVVFALSGALCGLLLCIFNLFGIKFSYSTLFINIILFGQFFIVPLLTMGSLPRTQYRKEKYSLGKIANATAKYIMTPMVSLFILVMYGYIVKSIFFHPGMVRTSLFAASAITSAIALAVILYPIHISSPNKFSKLAFRILPIAIIPLLVAFAIDAISHLFSTSNQLLHLYTLLYCLWCIIAIVLILFKPQKCLRWMVITFCSLFLVSAVGPQNFNNIAKLLPQAELSIKPAIAKPPKAAPRSHAISQPTTSQRINTSIHIPQNTAQAPALSEDTGKSRLQVTLYFKDNPVDIPKGRTKASFVNIHDYFGRNIRLDDSTITFPIYNTTDSTELARFTLPLKQLEEMQEAGHKILPPFLAQTDSASIAITELRLNRSRKNIIFHCSGILFR